MSLRRLLSTATARRAEVKEAKDQTHHGDLLQDAAPMTSTYRTLFMWPRSALRLIYKDVIAYYVAHVTLTLVYDFALNEKQREKMDGVSMFFRSGFPDMNGLAVDAVVMVSGFLFTMSVSRYFNVNFAMPGVQRVLICYIYGLKPADQFPDRRQWIEKYSKMILLMWALTFRTLSKPFRRKYPTLASLQSIHIYGTPLINDYERKALENCERQSYQAAGLQVFRWALTLLRQTMFHDGFLSSGESSKAIDALQHYKKTCGNVIKFIVRNIPLAASQSVIVTSYAYAILALLGRPFNHEDRVTSGFYGYFPLWSSAIMLMFFTWMRTALVVANPFGDDEYDIDCITVFDRHVQCVTKHVNYVNNDMDRDHFMHRSGCTIPDENTAETTYGPLYFFL